VRDHELPAALADDLDGAFEQLVRAYQDRLYAFALRLSGSPPDAEEIAQDAFVRAYRALAGYSAPRIRELALRPWLHRIVLNVFRNRVRGRHLPVTALDPDGEGLDLEDARERRPDALLERAERHGTLAALVAALPERYRLAVLLRHIQGLGYGEIAAVLGQPVGTAKAHVHRGVQLLRAALNEGDHSANARRTAPGRRERTHHER
jgi:RNA polymerase sigma-70 factor (ECF subfamily)